MDLSSFLHPVPNWLSYLIKSSACPLYYTFESKAAYYCYVVCWSLKAAATIRYKSQSNQDTRGSSSLKVAFALLQGHNLACHPTDLVTGITSLLWFTRFDPMSINTVYSDDETGEPRSSRQIVEVPASTSYHPVRCPPAIHYGGEARVMDMLQTIMKRMAAIEKKIDQNTAAVGTLQNLVRDLVSLSAVIKTGQATQSYGTRAPTLT
uniref:Uncharacterized protein n=1 Tax=Hymenopteran chu-related virus OKIAV146 TaxID=2792591 RepID=A0A7T0M3H1_9VIRU|nr:hypothetical protein [Hymenopteran chu-related virus OKIAV146]